MLKRLYHLFLAIALSVYPLLTGWLIFLFLPLWSFLRYQLITQNPTLSTPVRQLFSVVFFAIYYLITPICILFLFFWLREYNQKALTRVQRTLLIFIAFTAVGSFLTNSFLLQLEQNNYPNYLYAQLGIRYDTLSTTNYSIIFIFFLVFYILLQKRLVFFGRSTTDTYVESLSKSRTFLVVLGFFIAATGSFYPLTNARRLYLQAQWSYEQKFGVEYEYVQQLAAHTPERAFIIHPVQGESWPFYGNQPMIRYLLFPRTLVSGVLFTDQYFAHTIKQAYFAAIAPHHTLSPWPLIDPSQRQIIFDQEHSITYQQLEIVSEENGIKIFSITFYE
jgi:uncharacterized membrane protein YsdA (DUF1294 family)